MKKNAGIKFFALMAVLFVLAVVSGYYFVNLSIEMGVFQPDKVLADRTETMGVEERWESVKSVLHLQPIYKGDSKLLPHLCHWADPKDAVAIAYKGVDNGKPRFGISKPHWISKSQCWVEENDIPIEQGESLQLACGYRIRLDSFDKEEARFSADRW